MATSRPIRSPSAAVLFWTAVALFSLLGGCTVPRSRTQALLSESQPDVRQYEDTVVELDESDGAHGGLVRKGGCPVCRW